MATSLGAIGIIALAGTVSYAFHGELKPGAAAMVGLPAAIGAIAGRRSSNGSPTARSRVMFALLLAGLGVRLLI